MSDTSELALIGAVLLDSHQMTVVSGIVDGSQFDDRDLGQWFDLLCDMHDAGQSIGDMALVRSRLKAAGLLDRIGGIAGIAKATMATEAATNAKWYAQQIRQAAIGRKLLVIGQEIVSRAGAGDSPADITAWAEAALNQCSAASDAKQAITISEATREAIERIEAIQTQSKQMGVPTGLYPLDESIGGLYAGELAILAARPSIGKSALGAQVAMHAASKNRPVIFVSLEMTSHDLAMRQLASELGVECRELRAGEITRDQIDAAKLYADAVSSFPFHIWSTRSATVQKIRACAKVQKATGGLSLLVVDYLGLVHAADRRKPRWEQVSEVSGDLKSLALELEIPVLALCQLNREAEKAAPRLDHLRDAGAIEQDADVVMLLHREDRNATVATLDVAKARNGVTGPLTLGFDPARVQFTNYAEWTPD